MTLFKIIFAEPIEMLICLALIKILVCLFNVFVILAVILCKCKVILVYFNVDPTFSMD